MKNGLKCNSQTSRSITDHKQSHIKSLETAQPGKTQIRIVPYEFNKDNPFIELFFHYNLNNRSYLSPISFGRPDPIEEFAQKLKGSGNKEDYQLSKKLEAKMRTFASYR